MSPGVCYNCDPSAIVEVEGSAVTWAIVGAGAQGRIVLDILRTAQPADEIMFIDDDPARIGCSLHGVKVLGRAVLLVVDRPTTKAVVAIGHNEARLRVAAELAGLGITFGNVVHPSAVIMPSARLAAGIIVSPGAVIGSGASVGSQVLINTQALVEHDAVLEDGVSLSPGVRMGGRVRIERGAFIGSGATLNPRVTIGAGAIVGAGSLVTRSIGAGMLAYGVPAREIRPVAPETDWPKLL